MRNRGTNDLHGGCEKRWCVGGNMIYFYIEILENQMPFGRKEEIIRIKTIPHHSDQLHMSYGIDLACLECYTLFNCQCPKFRLDLVKYLSFTLLDSMFLYFVLS